LKTPSLWGLTCLAANLFLLSSRFHFFHFCFCYALSQAFSFGCLRAKEFYTWRTKAQKGGGTGGAGGGGGGSHGDDTHTHSIITARIHSQSHGRRARRMPKKYKIKSEICTQLRRRQRRRQRQRLGAEAPKTHEEKAAHCVLFLGIPLSQDPRWGI